MREPVVIRQDDQTELHVQAVIQSGRRQLDIRIWRRGPTGFSPSQSALTLERSDVDALAEGIAELLEASNGGRQVARVVWDKDEGRRLRAETEPFGTRFVARLGFWQRVRDTWRPAGDGLVLAADKLQRLQEVIAALRPRLLHLEPNSSEGAGIGLPSASLRWPSPGADWLTAEPDRLAFHPRGTRVTAAVEEVGDEHRLAIRQWRREESLWLPEDAVLRLTVLEVESLLSQLHELTEEGSAGAETRGAGSTGGNGSGENRPEGTRPESEPHVRPLIQGGSGSRRLAVLERRPPPDDYREDVRLSMPAEYLPRFGRMVAQAGMMLIAHLSAEERAELQQRQGPDIAPAIVSDALVLTPEGDDQDAADELGGLEATQADAEAGGIETSGEGQAERAEPDTDREQVTRRLVPLGEVQLGRHLVFLYLQEDRGASLSLQWDGYTLLASIDDVPRLVSDLRTLYYDALRGKRGRVAGGLLNIQMSAFNQGSQMYIALEQEGDGKLSRLSFPAPEVPAFLNAVSAAMRRAQVSHENPEESHRG